VSGYVSKALLRGLAFVGGVVALLSIGLLSWCSFLVPQSNIVDFRPSRFEARAARPFFYSIGRDLKYGDHIDTASPTLLHGEISDFLVSPNGDEIAVVANGWLTIVGSNGTSLRRVAHVDTIYREPKPIGQHFYRDDEFQWTRDSQSLYLIGDTYYGSVGSQLFSDKGELWKYDVRNGRFSPILRPFRAYNYFFDRHGGIYYSEPDRQGSIWLKYFDGVRVRDIGVSDKVTIDPSNGPIDSPFFSFSDVDYAWHLLDSILLPFGARLVEDPKKHIEGFLVGRKRYLTVTRGQGIKGPYYCLDLTEGVFLPGVRFFLLNMPRCKNYNGQLLFDMETGEYQRLPTDTRVYTTLNTESAVHYLITGEGIAAR
jgi:hypothetical protein